MRTAECPSIIPLEGPVSAPRIVTALTWMAKAWRVLRNRQVTMRLCDLSDAQLLDIGLTRADISEALAEPLLQDPSGRLNLVARDRAARFYRAARR
ncbi:DUF1127 domain-containing protein [Rhizobium sp. YIM 134829]|uniref:DUF1127 domain-containing protein n=1 Tax=Rhizobium sp. YIM 134829 TaxID=3390453 RepID=UPI00397D8257